MRVKALTSSSRSLLMDKQNTGWLVWGDSVEFYAVPPETASAITWDVSSVEAIEQVRSLIVQLPWWEAFIKNLSQEKTIDYLAADAITSTSLLLRTLPASSEAPLAVVKSIFQIFEDAPCEFVLPILEKLLEDKADRHKQRASGELIGGSSLSLGHLLLTDDFGRHDSRQQALAAAEAEASLGLAHAPASFNLRRHHARDASGLGDVH